MAKKPGKSVRSMADIEKEMETYAEGGSAKLVQTGGNVIGTRNERFTFKGNLIGEEMFVTVLDFVQANSFYEDDFDENNISVPGCFATSADGEDMAPPANVPNRQNPQCDGCPQNAFGSAEGSARGKACKNQYKLAVVDRECNDARGAEIFTLTLPPTSIKKWNEYVQGLRAVHKRPVWGVLTRFYFDNDDPNSTFKMLLPEMESIHKSPHFLGTIPESLAAINEQLLEGPDVSNYEKPAASAKRKPRARTAPAKGKPAPKAKAKATPKAKGGRKSASVNRSKFS